MAFSRRKDIRDIFYNAFVSINEGVSSYNSNYTYKTNLFNNVSKYPKFIDEINDSPYVCMELGSETRQYHSKGLTTGFLNINLRIYVRHPNSAIFLNDVINDLTHVINNVTLNTSMKIQETQIEYVKTDNGLFHPTGIGEISFYVLYELED